MKPILKTTLVEKMEKNTPTLLPYVNYNVLSQLNEFEDNQRKIFLLNLFCLSGSTFTIHEA
jgi:hypothetical protein